jgi:hypothetical protein
MKNNVDNVKTNNNTPLFAPPLIPPPPVHGTVLSIRTRLRIRSSARIHTLFVNREDPLPGTPPPVAWLRPSLVRVLHVLRQSAPPRAHRRPVPAVQGIPQRHKAVPVNRGTRWVCPQVTSEAPPG